ncbi:MAG: hypothetical protein LUD25_00620 [Coriobacteriaceae bacterium]|nr:hypothetical protein [Coriobacteriaceae bacterium]
MELNFLDPFFDAVGVTGGVLIFVGAGVVIFLLIAIVLEMRTRTLFPEHPKRKDADDDGFLDFGDDDDGEGGGGSGLFDFGDDDGEDADGNGGGGILNFGDEEGDEA